MRNKEGFAVGKRIRRMAGAVAALTMCLALSVTGMAAAAAENETLDRTRKGSLSITFTCDGKPISDGNKAGIFKVADVVSDNGFKFVWNGEFAAVGEMPKDLDAVNGQLAEKLVNIAKDKKVPLYRNSQELDSDGKVTFSDLDVGLYLVVHTKKVETTLSDKSTVTYTINPFLVSIPQNNEGKLNYDVVTKPKVSPEKKTTPPPKKPTPPPKRVPQTGQLWWPVMVMGITGALFVTFGLVWKMKSR